jgi:modulator of FtsH protease HflK
MTRLSPPHDHDHDHSHGPAHDHDHAHGHDHDHLHGDPFHLRVGAELDTSEMDPANRSLAEALRLSFGILKVVMVVLLLLFAFSGVFKVNEGEVAVRQSFGRLGSAVLEPGTYLSLPRPIDQAIRVPTSIYQVQVDDSFWVSLRPEDRSKTLDQLTAKTQLQPGEDGSLVTGDRNIIHGKWAISYQIDKSNVHEFIRNVSAATDRPRMLVEADARVKQAAERAIVHVVATVPAEAIIRGSDISSELRTQTQANLDALRAGITVVAVSTVQVIPPLSVRNEFDLVVRSRSERDGKIEDARKEQEKLLSAAAGPAHPALTLAIDYYETAKNTGDARGIELGEQVIDQILDGVPAATALAPLADAEGMDTQRFTQAATSATIGGEAFTMLRDAHSYRQSARAQVSAEAEQFQKLYPLYRANPQAYLALTRQSLLAEIYRSKVQLWPVAAAPGTTELWLDLNPDPRWQKAREEEAYRKNLEEEKRKKEQSFQGR